MVGSMNFDGFLFTLSLADLNLVLVHFMTFSGGCGAVKRKISPTKRKVKNHENENQKREKWWKGTCFQTWSCKTTSGLDYSKTRSKKRNAIGSFIWIFPSRNSRCVSSFGIARGREKHEYRLKYKNLHIAIKSGWKLHTVQYLTQHEGWLVTPRFVRIAFNILFDGLYAFIQSFAIATEDNSIGIK